MEASTEYDKSSIKFHFLSNIEIDDDTYIFWIPNYNYIPHNVEDKKSASERARAMKPHERRTRAQSTPLARTISLDFYLRRSIYVCTTRIIIRW